MVKIDTVKRAELCERDYVLCREEGLSGEQVSESALKYGKNVLTKKKRDSFFCQLLRSFNDPIIKILLGALVINALASLGRINWAESLGIVAAILISTLVSTVSEYSSSVAYSRFCEDNGGKRCSVTRDGRVVALGADELVVGDRVILESGMAVPCDGILSRGFAVCDQSALTGESREIKKRASLQKRVDLGEFVFDLQDECQIFAGSLLVKGGGEMTVLRVGDSTFMGEIAGELQEKTRPGPLKRRLTELAKAIGFMGYVGAFMIAVAYLFNSFFVDSGMDMVLVRERLSDTPFLLSEILRAVTVAVSVVVVAVPEGLPMMITVVLSSNMKKMMKGGVLVRRLVGIETAGNLNILFTDKTGTLTTGKMKVTSFSGTDWTAEASAARTMPNARLVAEGIFAACTAHGSPTERALCASVESVRERDPLGRIPFDSEKKYSAGLMPNGASYFVGAPEAVLGFCDSYLDREGELCHMDRSARREITDRQEGLSREGCRVLCVATGDGEAFLASEKGVASGLSFLCLIAVRDPVRRDVFRCVSDCERAGIGVVMVTGDNPGTAEAVAREAGILTKKRNVVLPSSDLHKMTDEEVANILPRLAVVSRALPSDKIRLVRLAEAAGCVVGMTGDGINDAPALKAADVGFAMGSGTDIAKEAGDIVITDDSFPSVTRAVLYGRTIFRSIRKFIVFQLLMNLSAMGISLIGPFVGIDSPVTVIQMLWVNIIMDTLGGLAFAGEPAMRSYMLTSGPSGTEKLISGGMLSQILITGGYTLALGLFFLKSDLVKGLFGGDELYHLTAFFAMFIFCGIFNSFNARTESVNVLSHLAGNKPFVFIMTLVAAVQLLIIYLGGEVFRCTPLRPLHLLYCALFAFTVIPADMIRKLIFKGRK